MKGNTKRADLSRSNGSWARKNDGILRWPTTPNTSRSRRFCFSVRAAGGYRDFVIEQRRTCALVRHLAIRDRATTRDGVLKFLARTGERALFRRVMSYLSPPPPQPTTTLNIRVRRVATEEQTFFKMKSTTVS